MASSRPRSAISVSPRARRPREEAALLAGLVKSPSRLAPTRNYDAAEARAHAVLAAMAALNFIPQRRENSRSRTRRDRRPSPAGSAHYVADLVIDVLDDLIGGIRKASWSRPQSIDPALQTAAEGALVDLLGASKGDEVRRPARVQLLPSTPDGAVRALVGGKNYNESQFNRAVLGEAPARILIQAVRLSHGIGTRAHAGKRARRLADRA